MKYLEYNWLVISLQVEGKYVGVHECLAALTQNVDSFLQELDFNPRHVVLLHGLHALFYTRVQLQHRHTTTKICNFYTIIQLQHYHKLQYYQSTTCCVASMRSFTPAYNYNTIIRLLQHRHTTTATSYNYYTHIHYHIQLRHYHKLQHHQSTTCCVASMRSFTPAYNYNTVITTTITSYNYYNTVIQLLHHHTTTTK